MYAQKPWCIVESLKLFRSMCVRARAGAHRNNTVSAWLSSVDYAAWMEYIVLFPFLRFEWFWCRPLFNWILKYSEWNIYWYSHAEGNVNQKYQRIDGKNKFYGWEQCVIGDTFYAINDLYSFRITYTIYRWSTRYNISFERFVSIKLIQSVGIEVHRTSSRECSFVVTMAISTGRSVELIRIGACNISKNNRAFTSSFRRHLRRRRQWSSW